MAYKSDKATGSCERIEWNKSYLAVCIKYSIFHFIIFSCKLTSQWTIRSYILHAYTRATLFTVECRPLWNLTTAAYGFETSLVHFLGVLNVIIVFTPPSRKRYKYGRLECCGVENIFWKNALGYSIYYAHDVHNL